MVIKLYGRGGSADKLPMICARATRRWPTHVFTCGYDDWEDQDAIYSSRLADMEGSTKVAFTSIQSDYLQMLGR